MRTSDLDEFLQFFKKFQLLFIEAVPFFGYKLCVMGKNLSPAFFDDGFIFSSVAIYRILSIEPRSDFDDKNTEPTIGKSIVVGANKKSRLSLKTIDA